MKQLFTEPQEMIIYESASVIHGRPRRLNGLLFVIVLCDYCCLLMLNYRSVLRQLTSAFPTKGWVESQNSLKI